MYTCYYDPKHGCKYCKNQTYCILNKNRQTIEKNKTQLENKIKNVNIIQKEIQKTGKPYKIYDHGEQEITYNDTEKKIEYLQKDLENYDKEIHKAKNRKTRIYQTPCKCLG